MGYELLDRLTGSGADFAEVRPGVPTLFHGDPSYLSTLFTLSDCDELLTRGLRFPAVEMAQHGKLIGPKNYTWAAQRQEEGLRDMVRPSEVARLVDGGATLIFNGLHRFFSPLAAFCDELGHEVRLPVHVTSYLTPPAAQGFSHHHDTDSVFIVQTLGKKRWDIYEPVWSDPITNYHEWLRVPVTPEDWARLKDGPPDYSFEVAPGDVLWLPRGWIHNPYSEHTASLHLTVAVPELTPHWLLEQLSDWLAERAEFRVSLPLSFASSPAALQDTLEAFTKQLLSADLTSSAAAEFVVQRYRSRFAGPAATISTILGDTGHQDLLLIRSKHLIAAVPHAGNRLLLHLGDRAVTLSEVADAEALARRLAEGGTATRAELLALVGNDPEPVLDRLVLEGLLATLDPTDHVRD